MFWVFGVLVFCVLCGVFGCFSGVFFVYVVLLRSLGCFRGVLGVFLGFFAFWTVWVGWDVGVLGCLVVLCCGLLVLEFGLLGILHAVCLLLLWRFGWVLVLGFQVWAFGV